MKTSQPASIKTRFAVSLIASVIRGGISLATGLLLARWLGAEDFGRMAFLLASFLAFKQLLDMASSSAFFTFLSKRQRSRRFVSFYWRWVGIQFIFSLLIVGLLLPESITDFVWDGTSKPIIILALVATFMQQNVWSIASQMAEAKRETIRVQRLNTIIVIIHFIVVIALWMGGKLFLPLLFTALIIEWSIAGWMAARMYHGQGDEKVDCCDEQDTAGTVFKEFWVYCKPFIPYVWLGFVYGFSDRWMLQHWGGSHEQAYYAVALQFSAVALLATSSILRIFWKEVAEAKHQGNHEKVKKLYLKVSRGLYFFGALAAGGALPWSSEIVQLLLGDVYLDGAFTLMLMFLYPIHQSMGQIGGTMLIATEHTRIHVIISLVFMATSIVAVYFMLAPSTMIVPGLGLASQGLAIKMLVMQFIQVNVMAWFVARIFGWKYDWAYQVVGLSAAVLIGWVAKLLITSVITAHVIVLMMGSAIFYLLFMGLFVYAMPWVAGMKRDEINVYLSIAAKKIRLK